MGYWKKQHSLRGNLLEELINKTNEEYKQLGLAVIQKIPTPITPVELGKEKGTITLAYFDKASTVDYMGNIQGIPVCFDAKETKLNYLPLDNIHKHQIEFMKNFSQQDGLSFLIISYLKYNQVFLCPFEVLNKYWSEAQNGGRKSIPFNAFPKRYQIRRDGNFLIHYLEPLQIYLNDKKENLWKK